MRGCGLHCENPKEYGIGAGIKTSIGPMNPFSPFLKDHAPTGRHHGIPPRGGLSGSVHHGGQIAVLGMALGTSILGAADQPVSYYNDLVPVLKRSCTGC